MKLWSRLNRGKRVRAKVWDSNRFIYKSGKNTLIDDSGKLFYLDLQKLMDEEWEEAKAWIVTEKRSIEVREFAWVKCPYCSVELARVVHNGLVQMYKYCPHCGAKVVK